MKPHTRWTSVGIVCLLCAVELWAQQADSGQAVSNTPNQRSSVKVPRLVKFSGVLKDLTGKPLSGPVEINFAIYKEQADAAPLWQETQTLQLDELGRYTVLLGAMQGEGLPLELFATGEGRWLGVQAQGARLQPRVLLVSVPYALKAADAETLGWQASLRLRAGATVEGAGEDGSRAAGEEAARQGATGLSDGAKPRSHADGDEPGANELHLPEWDERRLRGDPRKAARGGR